MANRKRLFIVSNRLPISIDDSGEHSTIKPASGGLVSAIKSYLDKANTEFSEVFWVGVPGCTEETWQEMEEQLPESTFTYLPVFVSNEQYEHYYNGFSNSVLWPLFHYFPSFAEYNADDFANYQKTNQRFAQVIRDNCTSDDFVWIHDYHLLPLASVLRKQLPQVSTGLFLHIPFPSYELIRLLPKRWQQTLLEGMLGADLIGFHTIDYAMHFLQSLQNILGIGYEKNILKYKDRLIKVDVFPISIDYKRFNEAYDAPAVVELRELIKRKMTGSKIIFSVDRLDYTKGVRNRLRSYQLFLKKNPGYINRVVFILVVVPSRDTIARYAERKRIIEQQISQINGEFGNVHWQPIYYQYKALDFDHMVALYSACDLALITPLRDGMNLVAKEFVASRKDARGVLVLSEMTGACRELSDALIINPNDTQEIAEKISEGLNMSAEEQSKRIDKMQKRIRDYEVTDWVEDFFSGLYGIKKHQKIFQEIFLDENSRLRLLNAYKSAKKRLLILDYDGTLVRFSSDYRMAVPEEKLLRLLQDLSSTDGNEVFLLSGRNSAWLEEHFGSLPINLIAEHGAKTKYASECWQTEPFADNSWKEQIRTVMEKFEKRCANTFIEEKEFSIVWHYRNADAVQAKIRAMELINELKTQLAEQPIEVMAGNKIVEVRNKGINKGSALTKVLSQYAYDFLFTAGDDQTDEDMFKLLIGKPNCFSIKVGAKASYAQYNLLKPHMVVDLLQRMNQCSYKSSLIETNYS